MDKITAPIEKLIQQFRSPKLSLNDWQNYAFSTIIELMSHPIYSTISAVLLISFSFSVGAMSEIGYPLFPVLGIIDIFTQLLLHFSFFIFVILYLRYFLVGAKDISEKEGNFDSNSLSDRQKRWTIRICDYLFVMIPIFIAILWGVVSFEGWLPFVVGAALATTCAYTAFWLQGERTYRLILGHATLLAMCFSLGGYVVSVIKESAPDVAIYRTLNGVPIHAKILVRTAHGIVFIAENSEKAEFYAWSIVRAIKQLPPIEKNLSHKPTPYERNI